MEEVELAVKKEHVQIGVILWWILGLWMKQRRLIGVIFEWMNESEEAFFQDCDDSSRITLFQP